MRVMLCAILFISYSIALAQLPTVSSYNNSDNIYEKLAATRYQLKVDRYKLTSPVLQSSLSRQIAGSNANYWTSAITSQSYGKGKIGTFYYWDMQGNLREMRGFIDIAGKNKRGLKLIFPWR